MSSPHNLIPRSQSATYPLSPKFTHYCSTKIFSDLRRIQCGSTFMPRAPDGLAEFSSFTIRHTAGKTMSHSDTQSGLIAAEQQSVGSDSVAVASENPNSSSQVYLAEPLPAQPPPRSPRRSWFKMIWGGTCAVVHWLFGLASLIVILSVLATLPILQFLSLGYLLEASGRIIRTKRLRDGLFGICLLYTSPSPRDQRGSRMPSSA